MEKIGFIGLGAMGSVLANNLLESGYSLSIYNRTREKAKLLVEKGAILVDHPQDLFNAPDAIVITVLANDKAVEEVVFGAHGLAKTMKKGCIHLSMSTISPKMIQKLTDHHLKHQGYLVASPVFGLPPVAAARKISICMAGDPYAKKRAEPILKHLSQRVFDFGDTPVYASVMKLIANFLILSACEAMAEGLNLGKKYGLDPHLILSMLSQSLFPGPIYEPYGKRIAAQEFSPPLFQLHLGLKDLTLLSDAAKEVDAMMPIGKLLKQGLANADQMGRGGLDWLALTLFISEGNESGFH